MKLFSTLIQLAALSIVCGQLSAQSESKTSSSANSTGKHLYIDVHHLQSGKVSYADVAAAHAKDLATEKKYGVNFIKYWVDTSKGIIYCLSSSSNPEAIKKTHADAHGLVPDQVYLVTGGTEASLNGGENLFLDVHELGAGNVKASDVAAAHQKDLAVEKKYGVNFINYWVNEKDGVVMCLSEAADSNSVINTHREAHGLLPKYVLEVQQGQ